MICKPYPYIASSASTLYAIVTTLALFACPLLSHASEEVIKGGPYDRKIAYIGGLSRRLFSGDRSDITIATEMFFREVTKVINHEPQLVVLDNIPEILDAMRRDKLDTIFANPIDYLALDHQVNPNYRYTITFGPSPEQQIYLLTQSGAQIESLAQLRGKRLTFPDGYILGMTYLEVELAKAGLPGPKSFFSSIDYTDSSNAAVLNVFFDKADLAVTSDIAYSLASELNPQLAKKIDVLSVSKPFLPFIVGVNKRVPMFFLQPVDEILANLKSQPKLQRILSLFHASDVVKITSDQLETLRQLKRDHERYVGKR
jgi:ABC-type phosphate/phosphonate transport system substrate-binding protein